MFDPMDYRDFRAGLQLCQAPLNSRVPSLLSFSPINADIIVGVSTRQLYVWKLERCDKLSYVKCARTRLPHEDAPLGLYVEPESHLNPDLIGPDETPAVHKIPPDTVAGKNQSLCGRRALLQVDPDTIAMGVAYNPTLPASGLAEYADTINNDPPRSGFSEFDLESMVYTTDGLVTGGRGGELHLLNLQPDQETDSSTVVGLVAPNRQTATLLPPGSSFVTLLGHLMHAHLDTLDEYMDVIDPFPITHIAMSPTFNKMLVVRDNGGLYIYKMLRMDGVLQQVALQKSVMGCHNPFVGVGIVNVKNEVFCVSADTEGNICLWNIESGVKVGEIVFEVRALCMRALPGIPVVLVGLNSGHVQFVDFSTPDSPRLLRSIRFYKKPVRGIFTDQHGDIIVITAKDEKIFLVSGDPGRNFEPLGFLDPEAHRLAKSHELRGDRLRLITLTVMLPLSGAFLNVIEPQEKGKAATKDEDTLSLGGLGLPVPSEETEGNEEPSDKDSTASAPLVVTLYSLDQVSHEIAVINLTQLVAEHGVNELQSLHMHQCSGAGVIEAAITPDMEMLVSGGSDGLLCAIPLANNLPKVPSDVVEALALNSKGKLKALQDFQAYVPVDQSANAYTGSRDDREDTQLNFNQNAGEDSASKSRSKNTPAGKTRGGSRQQPKKSIISFEAFIPKDLEETNEESEAQDPTWLEEEMFKQQREDVKTLTSTKEQIIEDMAHMNDNLTDLQRVETTEFELDTEEHNAILDETNLILKNKRKEIMCNDLIKRFTHDVIKKQCWDSHQVKGRSLLAYDFPIRVDNYPLYEMRPEQTKLLKQAQIRRRVEINLSSFRQKIAEAQSLVRKESTRDSEASSEDADEEEQAPEEKNLVQAGGTAEKFGVRTDLLYGQLEIFTTDQKLTQIILIKVRISVVGMSGLIQN
ncbi:unnamed protein product [Dibothriocephalus latus]|uniref:Cilia- and flagella-associated protein 43 n=1 Tax=Dibothriocephalus latus TaxID=60516 RepID=A0A3P6SR73_DIBLA|nr:unnamed protein product [Dibothriocephalus latus]